MYSQSDTVAGRRPAVYPSGAGDVLVSDGSVEVTTAMIAQDSLLGLCVLPARCVPVDFVLVEDDLDTGGALIQDVGVINAGGTDLVASTNFITSTDIGQAGGTARADSWPAALIAPSDTERIVGVKVTTGGEPQAWAGATVTSSGVNVTADDTVTINGKAYKFVAIPGVEGDVDIGATAAATLHNLLNAINHAGALETYHFCAAAHPTVIAMSATDTVLTLQALTAGAGGNALTLAKSAATLTVSHDHLTGGVTAVPLQGGTVRGILTYRAEEYGQ